MGVVFEPLIDGKKHQFIFFKNQNRFLIKLQIDSLDYLDYTRIKYYLILFKI